MEKLLHLIGIIRLSVNLRVDKLADHAAIAVNDTIGTVNGSNTLIKKIQVKAEEEKFMIVIMQIIARISKICLNTILLMQKVSAQMNIIFLIHQDMQMGVNMLQDLFNILVMVTIKEYIR